MEIVIAQSAYKHGFTAESIYSCLFNCSSDIMLENPLRPDLPRRFIVGFDHRGIAMEIIALEEIERNRLVVIHAMRLQKRYYHLLQGDAHMNYDEIDVEKEVQAVHDAMERGAFRPATKKENMALRLAALSAIVRQMQAVVESDTELVNA
jgi:hypothetical protein